MAINEAVLVDTNMLIAATVSRDINHEAANRLLLSLRDQALLISAPTLSEVFYYMTTRFSYRHAIAAFTQAQATFQIEPLTSDDMHRMEQIMLQYASAEFDFVDTALMAQAERLNITRVATFDRRDFSIFRPTHCEFLELLP